MLNQFLCISKWPSAAHQFDVALAKLGDSYAAGNQAWVRLQGNFTRRMAFFAQPHMSLT